MKRAIGRRLLPKAVELACGGETRRRLALYQKLYQKRE